MRRKTVKGNPFYSAKTLIYQVFSLAMKGVTIRKIEKACRKVGSAGAPRIIRILRSGQHYGRTWSVNERDGYIKVTPNTEIIPREKRKKKSKI